MKNAFYFSSKALYVLKIFKFLHWLFGLVAKRPDKKDKVNFKFSDVTAWLTNNRDTYILPNISRSKGNQTMKFGQLIEYNVRNIFLEKSYRNHNFPAETRPRSFSKKKKKGLGLISLSHILHNFWRKLFLLLYSINLPSFIVWLPVLREILVNMCCNCLLTRLWLHEFCS